MGHPLVREGPFWWLVALPENGCSAVSVDFLGVVDDLDHVRRIIKLSERLAFGLEAVKAGHVETPSLDHEGPTEEAEIVQ